MGGSSAGSRPAGSDPVSHTHTRFVCDDDDRFPARKAERVSKGGGRTVPFFSVIYTINSRVLCVACVFDAKRFGQCGWTKRALNSNVSCYYSPIYIIILLIVHEEVELSAPSTEKNTIESRLLHTEQIIASQCLFLV